MSITIFILSRNGDGMSYSQNNVIYGASSTMAQALSKKLAIRGDGFFLVGRNPNKLEAIQKDLIARGARQVELCAADLSDFTGHKKIWLDALEKLGTIHRVIMFHGVLGSQQLSEKDYVTAEAELRTNFLSYVSILTPIASEFEANGTGHIIVVSSVAGDRGRASNYIYGTSKAALTAFTSGLRNRLFKSGVKVLTVKPGLVSTAMTDHLTKNRLFASSERVADDVIEAMDKGKDVVYTPKFWRWMMLIIKMIPEAIFKRLKL